jgi:Family of unknown function (DUF6011)
MFNPANFHLNQPLEDAAREAEGGQAPVPQAIAQIVADLEQAAARYALRRDDFAAGKAETCQDIASKLERFGSFASEKQAGYAAKLIEWSKPRQPAAAPARVEARTSEGAALVRATPALPKLFTLMQRLAKLEIGKLTIIRKNQDSLCWIKHEDSEKVVGRLTEGGALTLWQRLGSDLQDISRDLIAIEADPEAAAAAHGKASGRCSVCSRDLTDPESIERGIGPICAGKFQF